MLSPVMAQLKQRRLELGITQTELAKKINTSQHHISALESGKIEPKITTVDKISAVLGVTLHTK